MTLPASFELGTMITLSLPVLIQVLLQPIRDTNPSSPLPRRMKCPASIGLSATM